MTCTAWITSNDPVKDSRRTCVLMDGHYLEHGPGGASWHTDCPDGAGKERPPADHYEHSHDFPCMVWADHAEGAHPDHRTAPAMPAGKENEPGRTLTDLGGFRADIKIGDTSASVYGPARFVAYVVRAMADAFEEEAER